jgi:hypothetical protein
LVEVACAGAAAGRVEDHVLIDADRAARADLQSATTGTVERRAASAAGARALAFYAGWPNAFSSALASLATGNWARLEGQYEPGGQRLRPENRVFFFSRVRLR